MSLRMRGKGVSALRAYITKFEKLVGKYHFACAEAQLQQSHNQSGCRSSQAPVISLDEPSLISIFQQSLKPESLRYTLTSQHFSSLKDAINEARNLVEGANLECEIRSCSCSSGGSSSKHVYQE